MEWTNTKAALLACAHYSLHIFPCCSALKKHLCRCSGSASGHRRQLRRGVMSEGLGSAIEICMHKMYSVLCTLYKVDKTHHLPTMYISGRRRMHRVAELLLYVVCLRTHSRLDSGAYIYIYMGTSAGLWVAHPLFSASFQGREIGRFKKLQTADWRRYILGFSQWQHAGRWQFPLGFLEWGSGHRNGLFFYPCILYRVFWFMDYLFALRSRYYILLSSLQSTVYVLRTS